MAKTKIFIYGSGGHGRVVADIIKAQKDKFKLMGFIDDNPKAKDITFKEFLEFYQNHSVALGIGDNTQREKIYQKLKKHKINIATLIHPSAIISKSAKIAKGVVIMPNAVVNSKAKIAKGAIINTSAVIEHDCIVKAFAHISPLGALAGAVKISKKAHIGIGTSIIADIHIGANSIVGAGSVVIRDIPKNSTAVGVPTRIVKIRT